MKTLVLILFMFLILTLSSQARTVTVMTYNVHNLFDAEHDEDKDDFTFLPLNYPGKIEACNQISIENFKEICLTTDWTPEKVELKLNKIHQIVSQVKPEILTLVEVENEKIVQRLVQVLGFHHFVMTSSPDKRGIDVALLYKNSKSLQFLGMEEHELTGPSFSEKPTRNILEVEMLVFGKAMTFLVNHWPSQSSPSKVRMEVAKVVKSIVKEKIDQHKSVVVTGDFNTLKKERPHPFEQMLLTDDLIKDVHTLFMESLEREEKENIVLGTYFYAPEMNWNLLDRFFVSHDLIDGKGLEADISSYEVFTDMGTTDFVYETGYNQGTKVKGVPFGYTHSETDPTKVGYSDHFPIVLKLKM